MVICRSHILYETNFFIHIPLIWLIALSLDNYLELWYFCITNDLRTRAISLSKYLHVLQRAFLNVVVHKRFNGHLTENCDHPGYLLCVSAVYKRRLFQIKSFECPSYTSTVQLVFMRNWEKWDMTQTHTIWEICDTSLTVFTSLYTIL